MFMKWKHRLERSSHSKLLVKKAGITLPDKSYENGFYRVYGGEIRTADSVIKCNQLIIPAET